MPREEAWHRNLRRTRKIARGVLTAANLGIDITPEVVTAAKGALIDHRATDVDTMPPLPAQQQKDDVELGHDEPDEHEQLRDAKPDGTNAMGKWRKD